MSRLVPLASAVLLACSSNAAPDGGSPLDAIMIADASRDSGADAGWPACPAHAPQVGGTTATDALADAPARCGAPAYAWLRDATLGDVVSREVTERYRAAELSAIAAAAGVTLPAAPEHAVRVERMVYVTQDRGQHVQSSTVLAYPSDVRARVGQPILLFLHGTSGFTRGCGPTGDVPSRLLTAVIASYGWIVAAPDYLGLESAGEDYAPPHPYLVGEAAALVSLDAARAAVRAIASDGGALCAEPRVAVLGGSQGGHAALWVDRLAPYYARELDPIGTVATVPPSDLVAQAERSLTEIVDATAATMGMVATHPSWYGAPARIGEALVSPWDVDLPAALDASCDPGSALSLPAALSDVFTASLLDAAAAGTFAGVDPFGCYARQNGLTSTDVPRIGPSSPSYGILFVLGENDTLVHTPIERAAYDTLCAAGLPLTYLECAGASHTGATAWALPEILAFLDARRAGEAFSPECVRAGPTRCAGTPP